MKNKINSITLGGIFAACYAILTALFVYALPILSSFSMIVLPIIGAFYSTKYNFKETVIFNLATIAVCFLVGLMDPFYCILYVLPSLIIGDVFGVLNHLNIKFYSTIFFQMLTFSIMNYITLILAEKFYETSIIKTIISNEEFYSHYSLCVLLLVSFAESILCSLFVNDELKKLKINKEIEDRFPRYGYLFILILSIFSIAFYFINVNFYNAFCLLTISLEIISIIPLIKKIKRKEIVVGIISIGLVLICLTLAYFKLDSLIFLTIILILSIFSYINYFKEKKGNF